MRKRQRFVLTTLLLALGLVLFRAAPFEFKYLVAGAVAIFGMLLFVWCLKEGLSGIEWVMLLILPGLFIFSFLLFTMLIPDNWLGGILSLILPQIVFDLIPKVVIETLGSILMYGIFVISNYSLLLTENIYSVAAIRTIQLVRAAHAVGFILTVATAFLCYYMLVTFRLDFWWLGLGVGGVSMGLLLPGIWSINLEQKLDKRTFSYSLWLSVAIMIMAVVISFWPIQGAIYGLFLATMMYVYLGLAQNHVQGKLFSRTAWEYITVGVVVLVTMLLTSGWGN